MHSQHHPAATASLDDDAGGSSTFETPSGLRVHCTRAPVDRKRALPELVAALDRRRGLLLSSGYEVPGRYRQFDIGFVDPPVCLTARGRAFELRALRPSGRPLLAACRRLLSAAPEVVLRDVGPRCINGYVPEGAGGFSEEQRTRQPTVLSVVRRLVAGFASPTQPHFGLYGAFGYDLSFQFDDLRQRMPRAADQRDLVLYLPDRLLVCDLQRGSSERLQFDFELEGFSEDDDDGGDYPEDDFSGFAGPATRVSPQAPAATPFRDTVRRALSEFARGELFEVTPGQSFSAPCHDPPSVLFSRLQTQNPAPFGFLANLGGGEFLVGASPEMFVRVSGRRVETCPIAGTIARGADALQDADQILTLLNCDKARAELTMCTDVDRNDKARVCEPGSVRVIGRRQVELYSRLIHTVDHVIGELRDGYDALDAFITHCWAVTVTGAPKQAAMQFIEDHEATPRRFYAGAVGFIGFDGSLNTGLTIRCMRIKDGHAEVRAGATLLHASDPDEEARECELKASALLAVLAQAEGAEQASEHNGGPSARPAAAERGARAPLLLIDHRDSFVHTLGDYFRQAGHDVVTLRAGFDAAQLDAIAPALVVLSPGPGRPEDFDTRRTLSLSLARNLPVFGVCLGLQAIVEYFGGQLGQLAQPRHGSRSTVTTEPHALFAGLPSRFEVGRYHSLFGVDNRMPRDLRVIARSEDDGVVMAVAHRSLPITAVQFHPESIMSASGGHGLRLVRNVIG